jgi:hypothetical protein
LFFVTNSYPQEHASGQRPPDMKVWKNGHRGSDPFKPRQVVHSDGKSSTGELLTYICYIFTIIGVVMFIICFPLHEKYKEEVVKKYGEDFNYEEEPIDGHAVYASRGGKAHGR